MIHEKIVRRAIVERYTAALLSRLELNVAIWGAGPSRLVAACYPARAGKKVAELFAER
jgi:ribulose 1,5-bisphosphate synthetase/thiazole synthase